MIEKAEFRRLSSQRWLIVIEGFIRERYFYVENTMMAVQSSGMCEVCK